jgi:dephospho-CoA kinase
VPPSPPPAPFPLQVGLTGNVASGKSTVARVWAEAGVPVVSADDLAREAVAPGSPGLEEVVAGFGRGVLRGDGTLDRDALRDRVFRDPEARERLEGILHPRIRALRGAWLRDRAAEGASLVVSEIPLLFETGLQGEVDVIVFVDAPEAERRRRLVEDRGILPGEAERIMASQGDPAEKRRLSHHVLVNDGSLEALERGALGPSWRSSRGRRTASASTSTSTPGARGTPSRTPRRSWPGPGSGGSAASPSRTTTGWGWPWRCTGGIPTR